MDNAMSSTTMSQRQIVDQIEHLSVERAGMEAVSVHAMSTHARGIYSKLRALILDSGCSKHMSPNRSMFTDYRIAAKYSNNHVFHQCIEP